MVNAHIERLDSRRLFSAANFADLEQLARNVYDSAQFPAGYFDNWPRPLYRGLSPDFASAERIPNTNELEDTSPLDTGVASARLSSKGKLTVTMGTYDVASVRVKGSSTIILLNNAPKPGETPAAGFRRTIKGVKSIELYGSEGPDSIELSDGVRFITVRAGPGRDTIRGSDGGSALYGGFDDDRISGGGGDDQIFGGFGNDRLDGGTGDDLLDGGAGKDRLDGYKGRNRLVGGSGTDYITVRVGRDKTDRDAKDRLTELS